MLIDGFDKIMTFYLYVHTSGLQKGDSYCIGNISFHVYFVTLISLCHLMIMQNANLSMFKDSIGIFFINANLFIQEDNNKIVISLLAFLSP